MQQEVYLSGNKMISEYMELSMPSGYHKYPTKGGGTCRTNELKYHYNWNWLMCVVEKISKIPLLNIDNTPCTHPQEVCYPLTFGMPTEDGENVMVRFSGSQCHQAPTLIEAVYISVIDFIDFENSAKCQK